MSEEEKDVKTNDDDITLIVTPAQPDSFLETFSETDFQPGSKNKK